MTMADSGDSTLDEAVNIAKQELEYRVDLFNK